MRPGVRGLPSPIGSTRITPAGVVMKSATWLAQRKPYTSGTKRTSSASDSVGMALSRTGSVPGCLGGEGRQRLGQSGGILHLEGVVALDIDHRRVPPAAGHLLRLLQRKLRAAAPAEDGDRTAGPGGVLSQIGRAHV